MFVDYMQLYGERLSSKWMHISAEGSSGQSSIDTNIDQRFLQPLMSSFERASLRKETINNLPDIDTIKITVNINTLYVTRQSVQHSEIIALATSYYNLGVISQEYNTENSTYSENALTCFTRSLELLEGVELDCNAILIAVKALLAKSVLILTNNELIKSRSIADRNEDRRCLYTAITLCIQYIEQQKFPRPICKYLADVSETEDLRMLLISLYKDMIKHKQTYYFAPTDMDDWIKNLHILLNNWISSINSLNEACQWSYFAMSISIYFLITLRFTEARNSLAAVEYIIERELSTTNIDHFGKSLKAAVADAWLIYAYNILKVSYWRQQVQQASSVPNQEEPQELLLFNGSLGEQLAGFSNRITNLYVSNYHDADKVYTFAVEKYSVASDIYEDLHFDINDIAANSIFISTLTLLAFFTTNMTLLINIQEFVKLIGSYISNKYTEITSYEPEILSRVKQTYLVWMNYTRYVHSAIEGNILYHDIYTALEMELQFISNLVGNINRVEGGATNL